MSDKMEDFDTFDFEFVVLSGIVSDFHDGCVVEEVFSLILFPEDNGVKESEVPFPCNIECLLSSLKPLVLSVVVGRFGLIRIGVDDDDCCTSPK